jgi:hypothetical protein
MVVEAEAARRSGGRGMAARKSSGGSRARTPRRNDPLAALDDSPRFTGGRNLHVSDFVSGPRATRRRKSSLVVEPLAIDVAAGKNDPVYSDHPYHTKVPYRAIVPYVLHYTQPGDVVLDGFCGSGMTGVAAQVCGDDDTLKSLGLRPLPTGELVDSGGVSVGIKGARRAVLADLSPLAGLLAYHHNSPVDPEELEDALNGVVAEVERGFGWTQTTLHAPTDSQLKLAQSTLEALPADPRRATRLPWAQIQFVVWSDVFRCPQCEQELVFFDVAVEQGTDRVRDRLECPHCHARFGKRELQRVVDSRWDACLGQLREQTRQRPVRINYEWQGKRYEKTPDAFDLGLWEWLDRERPPFAIPTDRMPAGRESRRNDVLGLTHVHHYYPPANLWLLGALATAVRRLPTRLRQAALLVHSAANLYASRLRRFRAGKKGGGPLSGTLYVSSLNTPASALRTFERNAAVFVESAKVLNRLPGAACVSVQSSTLPIAPRNSIDYVFVDPPFGGNLMYSELNFLWEAWLGVHTDATEEAVENPPLGKSLDHYQRLLTECFQQFHDALRPGRWMTVVFHHSDRRVWRAVQTAIRDAGFAVRDVQTLDKRQDSFKQINHAGSVKHDLVISAIKLSKRPGVGGELPQEEVERIWEFVEHRLQSLSDDDENSQRERSDCLLYSRVVADCVRRGLEMPLSANDFYAQLRIRFPDR